MRFERTMHMDREGQIIDANEAVVHLFADRDEPDLIELRGDSRVTGGTGMGALQSMSSRDMNLDYRDDGRSLQQATLAGQSAMQLAGKGGAAGQALSGEFLDIALAPDGSVSSLSSRQNVTVTLPATRDTAARTISSNVLTATGGAQGLSVMKFQDGVNYTEAATRTQGARVARAQSLDARSRPGGRHVEGGHVHRRLPFHRRTADGHQQPGPLPDRRRHPGPERQARAPPSRRSRTNRSIIDADAIDVTLNPRKMVATGKVSSALQPPEKATGIDAGGQAARPAGRQGPGADHRRIADLRRGAATRRVQGAGAAAAGPDPDQRRHADHRREQGRPERDRQGHHDARLDPQGRARPARRRRRRSAAAARSPTPTRRAARPTRPRPRWMARTATCAPRRSRSCSRPRRTAWRGSTPPTRSRPSSTSAR